MSEPAAEDMETTPSTVDPDEIARFAAMAESWWDETGDFKPLHKLNPVRLEYIRDALCAHFDREPGLKPLTGLRLLDIGCGGGLLAEPMARLGADVVGADATEANTRIAALHAEQSGLEIDYRFTTAEALAEAGERFDVVINMEVIEHVADVDLFVAACRALLKPDGLMLVSTLNRTPESYVKAIVGAEYVLRWLPKGTHEWNKFLKPSELSAALERNGFTLTELKGMSYNPFRDHWSISDDLAVNYLGSAVPV